MVTKVDPNSTVPLNLSNPPVDKTNPMYYRSSSKKYPDLQVIDAAEAFGLDKDAYLFTVFRYICRGGKKEDESLLDDLEKAQYYLQRRINNIIEAEVAEAFEIGNQ